MSDHQLTLLGREPRESKSGKPYAILAFKEPLSEGDYTGHKAICWAPSSVEAIWTAAANKPAVYTLQPAKGDMSPSVVKVMLDGQQLYGEERKPFGGGGGRPIAWRDTKEGWEASDRAFTEKARLERASIQAQTAAKIAGELLTSQEARLTAAEVLAFLDVAIPRIARAIERAAREREGGEPTTTDSAAKPTAAGSGAPGPVAASEQSPPSQTSPSPKADGEAAQDSGEPPEVGPPPTLLPTEQDGAGAGREDPLGFSPPRQATITAIWVAAKAKSYTPEDVHALAGVDSVKKLTERQALALVESW